MAIKVDLEKAYDRLNWDFLLDTLKDIGLLDQLSRIIMRCVSKCHMRVNQNREPTEYFSTSKGIRQGDPLSPYLFVICIDRLSYIIEHAINSNIQKPIKLSKDGPKLSHLFFADELILFAEDNLEQVRVIHACLDAFSKASGEKVNKDNTHMFVSRNVHANVALELSSEAGYNLVQDLGKYLGIPLHHGRVNRSSFQFVEEKHSECLSKWRSNFLSLAGQITLTKSILNTIPIYYMQTNLFPTETCERIDKISRDFIWSFSEEGKGSHLISWDSCVDPEMRGVSG